MSKAPEPIQTTAAPPRARRQKIVCYLPAWQPVHVPDDMYDLGQQRVAHLENLAFRRPLEDLLISAYLQGLIDRDQINAKSI